ncbi:MULTISPECIES: PLD nuclease N-terminal domain-containing protein [unclassified Lentimonas]|uniref:PLD nuclease N-terminal domain-containing protein n=1 Tax=unclassified Lentimonas TaxID=2630993 RepID=UPI001322D07C|nr:Unannotated [Lentimonas sp. CC4]CAA6687460.1 Unannotated [Lentimonas sp. CC6]CAA7076341.1 Unannotated [Lentimonas sp. CC4]CAA7172001.1 Unannotated [Lentimonas sp. CC21]CAA7180686.1 Unannotated [Lentimonas sp. CC8]
MTWIIIIVALIEIVWLWALIALLRNNRIDSTDKVCWTVVLCTLNGLGLLLYMIFGPVDLKIKIEQTDEYLSEQELKKAFNEGRR